MISQYWKGCFIAEGLKDPTILNKYKCFKFRITKDNLPLDDKGSLGRWHMYWIEAPSSDFDIFKDNMKYNWYGHFWKANKIVAIFEGHTFELDKNNKDTWKDAIVFGKSQNIAEDQLDFLTE